MVHAKTNKYLAGLLLVLVLLLAFLFHGIFSPNRTVFSNDGPLGAISSQAADMPSGFLGGWQDLNWLGTGGPSASPDISSTLSMLGKQVFSRVYAPFSLLFAGLAGWICFRSWRFHPMACFLGALAVSFNSDFFSASCWGVAAQPIAFGFCYLALAALSAEATGIVAWLRIALAGFAVGMAVMEAFDIGAIFSLYVAAFVVFQAVAGGGGLKRLIARGLPRLGLVSICAAFIAAGALATLVGTQIKGIVSAKSSSSAAATQTAKAAPDETPQEHWAWATQWSLPKREAVSLFIPGLFGYCMDTPIGMDAFESAFEGGSYWGAVGRDLAWDGYFANGKQGERPPGFIRYSGGGIYAGILVCLLAVWTVAQSFRKNGSVFNLVQRRYIWFWSVLAFLSLLLAFGRFAPFYRLFYALPGVSTIRNPAKFVHVLVWILLILFVHGLDGLIRCCMPLTERPRTTWKAWWAKASAWEKGWIRGSLAVFGTSALTWLIYVSSSDKLIEYLQGVDFSPESARSIATFSIRQAGWFLFWLALALLLVAFAIKGVFSGPRLRLGFALFTIFLVADLIRADLPWALTYNWKEKYASNPVIDFLREKPYQQRVAVLSFLGPSQFSGLYGSEWTQHLFQYYNIQSLDIVQMPRRPVDFIAFETAMRPDGTPNTIHRLTRRWALTSTRYLLGAVPAQFPDATSFGEILNKQLDPERQRFRVLMSFDVALKPGVSNPTTYAQFTAVTNSAGKCALFEFTGALPKAKLYSSWLTLTNDTEALNRLTSKEFDPEQSVIISGSVPFLPRGASTNQKPGTVEFSSYAPKDIVLKASAATDSVLLLNDRYDPIWKVTVDGAPASLLRANYLMRGVAIPAGPHTVEFKYAPPIAGLIVSIVGVLTALGILGIVLVSGRSEARDDSSKPSQPKK
jgi:hypothetical protein